MTENEAEVLEALRPREGAEAEWLAPLAFGGSNGSHHAQTAKRMEPKGWVERRFRGHEPGERTTGARGSCLYRITARGIEAVQNHRALQSMAGRRR